MKRLISLIAGAFALHAAVAAPSAPSAPSADTAAIARGAYLARASDCVACHVDPTNERPFAGGAPLQTPFGTLLASNISSDVETGIGGWTEAQFTRAVRQGRGKNGEYLYPAMPYTDYVKISDADMHDLWLYMRTVPPVKHKVVSNQLPFPFSIRALMFGWNVLFFDDKPFKPTPGQSAEYNRGAYLVQGPGHCEACHTGRNFLGGPAGDAFLEGGNLMGWHAPEITGNVYSGVGAWSTQQIAEYLRTGSNHTAIASGPMAEAVTNSTQYLTGSDLNAIAVYLKAQPGSSRTKPTPVATSDAQMALGKRVYTSNCIACHASNGTGIPGIATSFPGHPGIQARSAESLLTTVLIGGRGAVTHANPTGAAMPAFAWKLSDEQIAAVITYVRNSWGNAASPITTQNVKDARKARGAPQQIATH
jgi:mono/diheme cytochrome c family protein